MTDPKTLRDIAEQACIFDPEGLIPAVERVVKERDELESKRTHAIERLLSLQVHIGTGVQPVANTPRCRDELIKFVGETIERLQRTGQQNIGIVKKPPPPPPPAAPPLPNELKLSTEIDDELAQAAADYANNTNDFGAGEDDIALVRGAIVGRGKSCSVFWNHDASAFVEGARWQLTQIERAHAGDDNERDFWDAQVRVRAGDNVVIRFGREDAIAEFGMNDERFDGKSAKAIATMIRADLGQRKSDRTAEEITDELLLEAAAWANEFCVYVASDDDLENAKISMTLPQDEVRAKWSISVRAYVNGALRKARKV